MAKTSLSHVVLCESSAYFIILCSRIWHLGKDETDRKHDTSKLGIMVSRITMQAFLREVYQGVRMRNKREIFAVSSGEPFVSQ